MPQIQYVAFRPGKGFPGLVFLLAFAALVLAALTPVAAMAAGGVRLTHIAVGYTHSCGLTTGGGVMCWGENSHGQLGNGLGGMSTPPSPDPVHVAGLAGGVVDLSLGQAHSCALTAGGQVKCWGWNGNGQLGIGRVDAGSSTPVTVSGLESVARISSGEAHTCALTAGGGVVCWGRNGSGELGGGTIGIDSSTPVAVPGLGSGAIDIVAGSSHTCALTPTGGVKCWGDNSTGQLGNGTIGSGGSTPVNVSGLISGVTALSGGGTHNCALTTGGGVKCWGINWAGQLGDGTNTTAPAPVDVTGLTDGIVAVTAGKLGSTCAVTASGGIKCWGLNDHGQLGDGTKINRNTPVNVVGLPAGLLRTGSPSEGGPGVLKPILADLPTSTTVQVGSGSYHTCAFTSWSGDSPYQCWGGNDLGQLGKGTVGADQAAPAPVKNTFHSPPLQWLVAGSLHTCALTPAGAVKCWGFNNVGQLGDGTNQTRTTPEQVVGMADGVTGLAAGDTHTCALTSTGGIKCWGWNNNGQLGNGSNSSSNTPVNVVGLTDIITGFAAGRGHTCALTSAGGVKCWGENNNGQLGNGSNSPSNTPVNVTGLATGVTAIAAAGDHTCALTAAGGVKCWGWNGSLDHTSNTPVDVVGLPSAGATAIAAGGSHTCALVLDNLRNTGVMCWGENTYGEAGNGTTAPFGTFSAAASVIGLSSGIKAIAAGGNHTCALTAGGVSCWGNNPRGQLGDGTNTNRVIPVNVMGLQGGATMLAAGRAHTCAATGTGASPVLCWGDNAFGQFGDGTTGNTSNVPVPSKWLTADGLVEDDKGTVIIPPDPDTWIDIPPQTVVTPTVVTYTQVPPVTPPNGLQQIGNAFTLLPDDDAKPPIHMYFHDQLSGGLLRALAGNFDETTVNLYHDDNGTWVPVLPCEGCSVNPVSHTLVALINAWGRYAVMASAGYRIYLPMMLR